MRVADVTLDGTVVEFYNSNINEINFKYFENMISILIWNLYGYQKIIDNHIK